MTCAVCQAAWRIVRAILFFAFYVVTLVPGITLMVCTLGDFNYLAIGEAVQAWAERMPTKRKAT
jgi:hypothetical protein